MSAVTFKPTGAGNVLAIFDGFNISFNPSPGSGISMFAGDDDGGETALVVDGQFYILNGDFRKEYLALADGGLSACIEFFLSKPELKSSWSNTPDDAAQVSA